MELLRYIIPCLVIISWTVDFSYGTGSIIMDGRLTDGEMDTLEHWIGKGAQNFTLLYAITRDGCNAVTFHQKCDNQGPTVTVLYNQQGSVYGGYASASWNSSQTFVQTTDSFLFQLQYNNTITTNKFGLRQSNYQYSLYFHPNFGPTFGGGFDLHTFLGIINNAGGYFPLNGDMKKHFGNTYDNRGITPDKINNGNMNVIELEVYRVADGQRQKKQKDLVSWRKTKVWNEQFFEELKLHAISFKPKIDVGVTEARILMLGPVGSGKSSFYNTINSALLGRITQRACCGSANSSLPQVYTPYTLQNQSGAKLNITVCDTNGLGEASGLSEAECNFLLDGHLREYYKLGITPISIKSPGFKLDPTPNDRVHSVVFVLDSTTLDRLSTKMVDKMRSFQNLMCYKGIPQHIILTKIDRLTQAVEKDVSTVFQDETVKSSVEKASQLLGLPGSSVHPVKNYENEIEVDEKINILALLTLRQILNSAQDYYDNIFDRSKRMVGDNTD